MKRRLSFLTTATLSILLALTLLNVAPLRCESNPDARKVPRQAKNVEKATEPKADLDSQDDKSRRFQEFEWIIRQDLMSKYEKLAAESPDDIPD